MAGRQVITGFGALSRVCFLRPREVRLEWRATSPRADLRDQRVREYAHVLRSFKAAWFLCGPLQSRCFDGYRWPLAAVDALCARRTVACICEPRRSGYPGLLPQRQGIDHPVGESVSPAGSNTG